ncbi:MAG TPA: flagellar biosynthesis protein FlhF [Bryobacteraceae bacterium]|nr:flagellar biosynthesis protein FlhF [Bryobacteraceae bacterium]
MKIKSYFAHTVEAAMAMAREELGPEAMLVNTRKTPQESRHLGDCEVVFAAEVAARDTAAVGISPPAAPPSARQLPGDCLSREVADLKKELEGMRRALLRPASAPAWREGSPEVSDACAALTANEVTPDLARDIVQGAEARVQNAQPPTVRAMQEIDATAFRRALVEEVESRVMVQPVLGSQEARPRVVALVGPPGSGKTTTLVKLAVNYGLTSRRPILLLSVDTYRVAAAEQLRSYATILGVGCQVLETVAALAQAIEEHRSKELILIDTPGLGLADLADFSSLSQFLSTRREVDTHLVLSASMKSADVSRVVDGFEAFRPHRLIFTKLDETGSFGPILNQAVRTGKALSFFTSGQRIPEDLEAARCDRLAELVLGGQPGLALSAA